MPIAFVKLMNLLKSIDDLPMPMDVFNRHRWEYNYILSQVYTACLEKKSLNITMLTNCNFLGSQPTAHKRIKELTDLGLIEIYLGNDRREKYLRVSKNGEIYLSRCSKLMLQAIG